MNPTHNEQPNLSLPAPSYEIPGSEAVAEASRPKRSSSPESIKLPNQPNLTGGGNTPQINPPVLPAGSPALNIRDNQQQSNGPVTTAPTTANDVDLIEKEWVAKAKQIVESNREDPYVQNKEINRFKADYIKKRYNKNIRVTEE